MMMGVPKPHEQNDGKSKPAESHGVKLISMGFFVPEETAVVWRGPMIHTAIQQFLRDVIWGFFFQAEDGIRDVAVTGVQTCALPISTSKCSACDQHGVVRDQPAPGEPRAD